MTKRQAKGDSAVVYTPQGAIVGTPQGAIIHATNATTFDAVNMAIMEQFFEIKGPTAVARLLAERLRDPSPPHPEFLEMMARWLDPKGDDCFRLVVERRRDRKTWTKRVNDAAIAKAVREHPKLGSSKRGSLKDAVGEIAGRFGISDAKVRQVIRTLRSNSK